MNWSLRSIAKSVTVFMNSQFVAIIIAQAMYIFSLAGHAMPLVKVSSTYVDQVTHENVTLSGYGVLIEAPSYGDLTKTRFWVLTVSHLSQGDVPNSLKIRQVETSSDQTSVLQPLSNRYKDIANDLELIEVSKPLWPTPNFKIFLTPDSLDLCQLSPRNPFEPNVTFSMVDTSKVELPLTSASKFSDGKSEAVMDSLGLFSLRTGFSNKFVEGILISAPRLNSNLVTGDLIVSNFAQKGMSGLPLFVRRNFPEPRICLQGLVRAVHRIFQKTFLIGPSNLYSFVDKGLKEQDNSKRLYPKWIMKSGETFRIFDVDHKIQESVFLNEVPVGGHDTSDGGGHDTSDGGGHDTSDGGGHDTSDGGGHDTSDGGRGGVRGSSGLGRNMIPEPGFFDGEQILAYQHKNELYYANFSIRRLFIDKAMGAPPLKRSKRYVMDNFSNILKKRIFESNQSQNDEIDYLVDLWKDQEQFVDKTKSLSLRYRNFQPSLKFERKDLTSDLETVWPLCKINERTSGSSFDLMLKLPIGVNRQFIPVSFDLALGEKENIVLSTKTFQSNGIKVFVEALPVFGTFRIRTSDQNEFVLDLTGLLYFNSDYAFAVPDLSENQFISRANEWLNIVPPNERSILSDEQFLDGFEYFINIFPKIKKLSDVSSESLGAESLIHGFSDYYSPLASYYNKRAYVVISPVSSGFDWPVTCF